MPSTVGRDATITYFPVGNGDTSLITLADGTSILIDLDVRGAGSDDDDPSCYDVHAHLLKAARRDAHGRPHIDVFILTHPDQDHLRGVDDVFYRGAPMDYAKEDEQAGRIIVDELWFAPRIFAEHEELCEDAEKLRMEADRRIVLYRKNVDAKDVKGNRLRIIGASDDAAFEDLAQIVSPAGSEVEEFNGVVHDEFSVFVHAPFKADTDGEDVERNDTSVVLQARFAFAGDRRAVLALFGGDAGCAIWSKILERSDDEDLQWDLLLAPHHCSWTFFSEGSSDDEDCSASADELLAKHRLGAFVISSSKPVKDDDDNPPHYIAAQKYREVVGDDNFVCTGDHGDSDAPEPVHFSVTANGPVRDHHAAGGQVKSSAARKAAIATPQTYG